MKRGNDCFDVLTTRAQFSDHLNYRSPLLPGQSSGNVSYSPQMLDKVLAPSLRG